MPEMKGLVLKGFTLEEFQVYVKTVVAKKMGVWRPRGFVLHNTGTMEWPGHTPKGVQITPEQRIKNMSVDWVARHFDGGPHLLISPDGMIWAVWPMWLPGTHSPSWNHTHWGMEMVGDFDKEKFPPAMNVAASGAMAAGYAMLGHAPDKDSFHLHKQDPRTTHKRCPGVNCGSYDLWLKRINDEMHAMNSGSH